MNAACRNAKRHYGEGAETESMILPFEQSDTSRNIPRQTTRDLANPICAKTKSSTAASMR
jgi:hypothetical protein